MNWEIILPALVGFASGTLVPLIQHFANRRNLTRLTNADVMGKIVAGGGAAVDAAIKMLNELQEENARLRLDLSNLRTELHTLRMQEQEKERRMDEIVDALKDYIGVLINTLREHNIEIPKRPEILKESDPKIRAIRK